MERYNFGLGDSLDTGLQPVLHFVSKDVTMNADTYKSYSVTCPICHQTSIVPSVGILGGLFTCPHCHTHFVISHSGHYVRDPFCLRRWAVGQMLRRQSHPLARIGRDFYLTKRFPFVMVVSSLLFISVALATMNRLVSQPPTAEPEIEAIETDQMPDQT